MPKKNRKEYSRSAVAADAVGIAHLIIGTLLIIVGEFTPIFEKLSFEHGGVQFIFQYLDAPVYYLLRPFMPDAEGDSIYLWLSGLAVITLSSMLYALVVYLMLRFMATLFDSESS